VASSEGSASNNHPGFTWFTIRRSGGFR
jgi:hypothetical protein